MLSNDLNTAEQASSTAEILILAPLAPQSIMDALEAGFRCHHAYDSRQVDKVVAERGGQIRGLVTTGGRGADKPLIDGLSALEIISVFGVGVDAVDLPAAKMRGIAVTNTPDVLTDDVADFAIGLYLSAIRLIAAGDRAVRAGVWAGPLGHRLPPSARNRKVGILGMGRIGRAIAHRLSVFDAEIGYAKAGPVPDLNYRHFADPVALAEWSDVLFLAVPGGPSTRNLVGRAVLEALGPSGLLINIARGSVVDEPALCAALQSGALGGAALDVFAQEPNVPDALKQLENVLLTPHIGSCTYETRQAMGQLVVQNIANHFAGRPLLTAIQY